jgi:hypothetical protein
MSVRNRNDGKKTLPAPEKLAERLPDRADLARRLDALSDELAATRDRLQDVSAQVGRRATRRGRGTLATTRTALGQARGMAAKLPGPGEMLTQTRSTGGRLLSTGRRLLPGDARKNSAKSGRLWRRWLAVGAGIAALGGAAVAILQRVRGRGTAETEPAGEEAAGEATEAAGDTGAAADGAANTREKPGGPDGQAGGDDHFASDYPLRSQQ